MKIDRMDKSTNINQGISPSQFMRQLRPEYYSDTDKDQVSYVLDKNEFEYKLETITSRNETQDFETFCRKLCQRTICPNLRSHTGPDGGGDSKVDTETYPITSEISDNFYIGDSQTSNERWAFAFSANKDWKKKVKDDVKKIAETEREYKRIIFVTSRFAKDKDRSELEDTLSKEYSTPVTIHDRAWIVEKIIDEDRKDLAFHYLQVGTENSAPHQLGSQDYSRLKQLEELERDLSDPEAYEGMKRQRVTDALIAAKLSRNLEKPRTETDGRFQRALRYADSDGSERQKLEVRYEHIWTAFWWFDDFETLKNSYDGFEKIALQSEQACDLEFLCNLLQLLFNGIIHDHLDPDECKIQERTTNLQRKLDTIAKDQDRPNNAAAAQLSLLIIRMNQAILDHAPENLSNIWYDFSDLLKKVEGLGEFRADRLEKMIEVAGQVAGNDPAYNALVEQAAEFFAKREGEAKSATVLLKRAEQLDFDSNFEMIRLLGKASVKLTKKEHSDLLIQATQLLMLAYRSAGMLWAARASCTVLASSLVIEGEEESEIPASFVPTMKIWGWIALELGNLPDFLFAIQMLNGAVSSLPLTDESKQKVYEDLQEMDAALGCLFLNLSETELTKLSIVPDVLDALGLFMARSALLFVLGHKDVLHADGSIPESESEEETNRIFSLLYSQPVAENLPKQINLNEGEKQTIKTILLGMLVEVSFNASQPYSVVRAQAVLGALEAFFSTTLEQRISPHREKLSLLLKEIDDEGSFDINTTTMHGVIAWPKNLSMRHFEQQGKIHEFLTEISGKILAAAFMISDPKALLENLYANEEVHQRMVTSIFSSNSYSRVTLKEALRLSDWQDFIQQSYELKSGQPQLQKIEFSIESEPEAEKPGQNSSKPPKITDHRSVKIHSVIDIHAWDQAKWRGTAYAQYGINQPPCMAFMFENEEGARKIFDGWHERFGREDKEDEIYISIVRNLPDQNKHHYCLQVSSKLPTAEHMNPDKIISIASRSIVMEPKNDENLERFLKSYHQAGAYLLMPSILKADGAMPELLFDISILKRKLIVKTAKEIKQNDIEIMALRKST